MSRRPPVCQLSVSIEALVFKLAQARNTVIVLRRRRLNVLSPTPESNLGT
jgi:hypothetical protein